MALYLSRPGLKTSQTILNKSEQDQSESSLNTLLAYARAVSLPLEQIVDDNQDLAVPAWRLVLSKTRPGGI